jgi:hypothetical protein
MSHVFEHLYNPRTFVENISKHAHKIILSIPSMNYLLSIRSPSIVFNEHTYFVDRVNIEWLFSNYQYKLVKFEPYKSHSLFMVFEKAHESVDIKLENRRYISATMLEIFNDMARRFSSVPMVDRAFIAPAGHMGQMFFSHASPRSPIGFLDNDRAKQGRRVYGTPYTAFPFDVLKDIENPVVYLYGGVYTNEIASQILHLNGSTRIYEI